MPIGRAPNSEFGVEAQLLFHARVKHFGLEPLFKSDDSLAWDCGVYNPLTNKFFRVQVKSTSKKHSTNRYRIFTRRNQEMSYAKEDADIVACYIGPENEFFLFPIDFVVAKKDILLPSKDGDPDAKLHTNREFWEIFGPLDRGR